MSVEKLEARNRSCCWSIPSAHKFGLIQLQLQYEIHQSGSISEVRVEWFRYSSSNKSSLASQSSNNHLNFHFNKSHFFNNNINFIVMNIHPHSGHRLPVVLVLIVQRIDYLFFSPFTSTQLSQLSLFIHLYYSQNIITSSITISKVRVVVIQYQLSISASLPSSSLPQVNEHHDQKYEWSYLILI